ncbi:MAG: DNA damage-inducible protein D [Chlamydiales bacterium]
MNKNIVETTHHQTFESIKQEENGCEFWSARKLSKILEYFEHRNFLPVIDKAKEACKISGHIVADHFVDVHEMIEIGKGGQRQFSDIRLSRYGCYLIVQNGDPSKPIVANGQTYFAIQTRRQELANDRAFQDLEEDEKRLFLRNELRSHNKILAATAYRAGVHTPLDFVIFQDHGYKGLYGGEGAKLQKGQEILDYMGSTETAANYFRVTQTEEKLRRDKIQGKSKANQTHFDVGEKVRKTIEELGGTMPEKLPIVRKSIKQLEKEKNKPSIENTEINAILQSRLEPSSNTKVSRLASQSVDGDLSSFSGVFQTIPLTDIEKDQIENLLHHYGDSQTQQIDKDLEELSQITCELKAIHNQSILLHGERIKKAQILLKTYKDGAFSSWLVAVYGNRQTPYNFLQYYELYIVLSSDLQKKIVSIPRQAIYTLASRKGSLQQKKQIVEQFSGESKEALIHRIRKTFPLKQSDKRTKNAYNSIYAQLIKIREQLYEQTTPLSIKEKKSLGALLQKISHFFYFQ